ncbi:MAG: DUF4494 domain-containing protein [Bacteroidia bacterium]|nr:DUF4494 domain-containing protein [Bacteroidia bacterium]
MHTWFETVVSYEKTGFEGRIVKSTEHYLVDALTHAEAENKIIEEMKPFISGEFQVSKVARKKIAEIFYNEDGDKWYRAKVNFITLDEEKGVEKRSGVTMLVQASDVKSAVEGIIEGMKGSMADWEIHTVAETPIMDIYKYEAA